MSIATSANLMAFGDSVDDYWDDTELIKAYEEAVKSNARLVKPNIGLQLEESQTPGPWEAVPETLSQKNVPIVLNGEGSASLLYPNNVLGSNNVPVWKVDSYCRAVYSEDGEEYEGKIIEIDEEYSVAVVRFIGYENEEEVDITDLLKSQGKKSRERQKHSALAFANTTNQDTSEQHSIEAGMENLQLNPTEQAPNAQSDPTQDVLNAEVPLACSSEIPEYVRNIPGSSKQNFTVHTKYPDSKPNTPNWENTIPKMFMPPMPTSITGSTRTGKYGKGELPSLLMAWYMSGYHAGYFDAKQDLIKK